jgi:hypothetical protein
MEVNPLVLILRMTVAAIGLTLDGHCRKSRRG